MVHIKLCAGVDMVWANTSSGSIKQCSLIFRTRDGLSSHHSKMHRGTAFKWCACNKLQTKHSWNIYNKPGKSGDFFATQCQYRYLCLGWVCVACCENYSHFVSDLTKISFPSKQIKGKDLIWTKSIQVSLFGFNLFVWDAFVWPAAASGGADMVALMFYRGTQKNQEISKQKCNIMLQKNRNAT